MVYNVLINQISETIANRYSHLEKKPKPKAMEIIIGGACYTGTAKANDIIISISKKKFYEIAGYHQLDVESKPLIDRVWKNLMDKNHFRIIESKVTNALRQYSVFNDLSYLESDQRKLTMYFRHSSNFITQTPQNFYPLFQGDLIKLLELKQGEFAITSAKSEKPVLATWHFAECVGLIGFCRKTKVGILAHIDLCADLDHFFTTVKEKMHRLDETLVLEYALIGGRLDGYGCDHRENIKKIATSLSDDTFTFKCIAEPFNKLPMKILQKDSVWGMSMRLQRSIAIDTREPAPLTKLMSYEPHTNENSSLHKRSFTYTESRAYELKRERERKLNLVHCISS